jgi:hypothetical protein
MMILGVDYHPSDQYIAFIDTETGECGERRLNDKEGEAETFYRELATPGTRVRVGVEATGYSGWFERLLNDATLRLKLLMEENFPRIRRTVIGALRLQRGRAGVASQRRAYAG